MRPQPAHGALIHGLLDTNMGTDQDHPAIFSKKAGAT